ncbi:MAG: helix-turn-helix transcriptional regulator [Nostoc sp. NMS7]|uniref:helix-turn-helix domain-containing protein n=1 Tax=Nostoc sp. NMS7 TaxID=2815391 RepID=UPI0025CF9C69|nr:helix-turn-helix transcriptional regulator [Nostoc sp. NMS7]MBN3948813.1 helix-turn-helix transcriptional regulator [Nostoc sp. NMS7]
MPMRNRIKEFVDSRGISVYQFWQETGISRTTAYSLYNNSAQYLGRDVMDAICSRYNIQPDILLKWIPAQELKNGD